MGTFKSVNSLGVHPAQTGLGSNPAVLSAAVISSTTVTGSVAVASTGSITLITSGATAIYVYAYTIAGPVAASSAGATIGLYSGSTSVPLWNAVLNATSTTLGGADSLAVTPPAYLFRSVAGDPVLYIKGGSSVAGQLTNYSFAFWRA